MLLISEAEYDSLSFVFNSFDICSSSTFPSEIPLFFLFIFS